MVKVSSANRLRRKLLILTFFFILVTLAAVSIFISNRQANRLSNRIIAYIDKNCKIDETCQFSMNDVADFEWDKMVMYQLGASEVDVSRALGVNINECIDISTGMIFVNQDKVVYSERIGVNPDNPPTFVIVTGSRKAINIPDINLITNVNQIFEGTKASGSKIYYLLKVKS